MASAKSRLSMYRKRRSLKTSGEPVGTISRTQGAAPIFVVQKHAARQMHYDFRLEIEGVLVSWAVPKGPSVRPRIKRLAMRTEDHPMEYADFEGVIPHGYGAGTVMVWDRGTYKNIQERAGKLISMKQCLKNGRIKIFLQGHKMKGAYALVRTNGSIKGWLLIKMRGPYAHRWQMPKDKRAKSVITGRTLQQIAREE